ncbi:MAG: hypothetical protein ABL871_19470, partial [Terricaulis sp.]
MVTTIDVGFDRYDRNARLKPALLVILPLLLLVAVWLKEVWTSATALLGVVVFCGLIFLVSRIARYRGRLLQKRIERDLGGLPTTIALRHRDTRIDGQTKARYHAFLRTRGLVVPTADEEQINLAVADGHYRSCVAWLLEATRDKSKFKMIADENIDFGFRRNLVGLKPVAIAILVIALILNAAGISMAFIDSSTPWEGIVLFVMLGLTALAWVYVVTDCL